MNNNDAVDAFIKSDTFGRTWHGRGNTKIRRFNPECKVAETGIYQTTINGLSLISKSMSGIICLIEVDGDIVFCVESDDAEKVKKIITTLNPDITEYKMIFRPMF